MLEYYVSYWNYIDNMNYTEELLKHTLQQVIGTLEIEYQGQKIDFSQTWQRKSLQQVIQDETGIDIYQDNDKEKLLARMQEKNIRLEDVDVTKVGWGTLVDSLYKKECRPKIISPMFLTSHPRELSPLARANDDNPQITDRFLLVVSGMEIVNAYSEAGDPVDQRDRLMAQQRTGKPAMRKPWNGTRITYAVWNMVCRPTPAGAWGSIVSLP